MAIELVFTEETPIVGRIVPIVDGAMVGRFGCDVVVTDPEVSRRHAIFREVSGSMSIEDLGSRNGTFVNGERITGQTVLKRDDTIQIGNTVWRLRAPWEVTQVTELPKEGL